MLLRNLARKAYLTSRFSRPEFLHFSKRATFTALAAKRKGPLVLCILDGWGHRVAKENNAIAIARTPNYDALAAKSLLGLLEASEEHVGLPEGQVSSLLNPPPLLSLTPPFNFPRSGIPKWAI